MMNPLALEDLREPLTELGRRSAQSIHRPRPRHDVLNAWDDFLARWAASDLPLILRDSARRGLKTRNREGGEVFFGDNTPANWSMSLALEGQVPDVGPWSSDDIAQHLPYSMIKRNGFKRDLNQLGWKVCHIQPVSDRTRAKVEKLSTGELERWFVRFISPRNMFLIPKSVSGAGEIDAVIQAVAAYDERS